MKLTTNTQQGMLVVTDEAGKAYGNWWKQPVALITVGEGGLVDHDGDSERVYAPVRA